MSDTSETDDKHYCFYCGEPVTFEDVGVFAHAGWVHWSHIHAGQVEL